MRIIFFNILILCGFCAQCQFLEDFSDGNITENPTWHGNVDHFRVNELKQLQLNAPAAGASYIYTETTFPDSMEIGFDFDLGFNPSASNAMKFYFMLTNPDPAIADGYVILAGENGSADALRIYRLRQGVETLLASGQEGALSRDPSGATVRLSRRAGNQWEVFTRYNTGAMRSEFAFEDSFEDLSAARYLGFYCVYTATRTTLFYMDDIFVREYAPDTTPPTALSARIAETGELVISFSEPVSLSTATDINNYEVVGFGKPVAATYDSENYEVWLEFTGSFLSSTDYSVTISGVFDLSDNGMAMKQLSFSFIAAPELGDILISEILFDPIGAGSDFVELYNASDKKVQLQGLIIRNGQRNENKTILEEFILLPKSYVAYSEDIPQLLEQYIPENVDQIAFMDLPAFNNDKGNVSVLLPDGTVLDSFNYTEDMHLSLIDDTEGISLERLSFETSTTDPSNWSSGSATTRFATPGYKNSNAIEIITSDDFFNTVTKIFDPNQGNQNKMVISYALPESGFIANIAVFDSEGYKITDLMTNTLLGTNGLITWDGTDADGNFSRIGTYIINGEAFNERGRIIGIRKVCVLANQFD